MPRKICEGNFGLMTFDIHKISKVTFLSFFFSATLHWHGVAFVSARYHSIHMLLLARRQLLSTIVCVSSAQSLSRSMSSITTRDGGGTITVAPRNEAAQSALVVISHGLGDTAEGFVDVAEVSSKRENVLCWSIARRS